MGTPSLWYRFREWLSQILFPDFWEWYSNSMKKNFQLEAENEAFGGGLRHIKRWCSGEIVTLNPRQILDAVVRMCDDALLKETD